MGSAAVSIRDALRVRPGVVNLAGYDPADTPHAPSKKKRVEWDGSPLPNLQERLFAEGTRSVLLVLQGIDTAGKGGVVNHVVAQLAPEGVRATAFKAPTPEE